MTSDKRMSDERAQALNDLREERDRLRRELNAALESRDNCVSEIDALRAELTAARTVGLENYNRACRERDEARRLLATEGNDSTHREMSRLLRERDEARAALAQAREVALEEAVKIVAGFAVPTPIPTEGVLNFIIQRDFRIAEEIRALKTTPTQESETP